MRAVARLPLLCCLAACATSTSGPGARTETVRVATTSSTVQITSVASDAPTTRELPASADAVWQVLPAVYDSLGIPVARLEPGTRTIGNDGLRVRRRLGTVALPRYLDCGSTQGGPNAENYDVHLTIQTHVTPGEKGNARIATLVQAQAKPVSFAGEWVRCASKDLLEESIAKLAARLAL